MKVVIAFAVIMGMTFAYFDNQDAHRAGYMQGWQEGHDAGDSERKRMDNVVANDLGMCQYAKAFSQSLLCKR